MRITNLHIEGLRTIDQLHLDLQGLQVLIGTSGSGKSTIIEACELLRRAAGERFLEDLHTYHGGLSMLLRQGATRLLLGVTVKGQAGPLSYRFSLSRVGSFAVVEEEHLDLGPLDGHLEPLHLLKRQGPSAEIFDTKAGESRLRDVREILETFDERRLLLPALRLLRPKRGVAEVHEALQSIAVHLPFETMPAWAALALDRKSALRSPVLIAPAEQLSKLGTNLANAYHALRNDFDAAHWEHTLRYLRLGLGDHVEDVYARPDPGGGSIMLRVKYRKLEDPVYASQLSDGTLSFMAFVAMYRLSGRKHPSLLALDEPDLHLHPELLMRVLQMFEDLAEKTSVLIATHSDRLLDGLSNPAESAVLCELDEHMRTRLYRPDPARLAEWLKRYRGLGQLRSEGYEAEVMSEPARLEDAP